MRVMAMEKKEQNLSLNTRNAKWGSAAIETISRQLRKELPGLRGFSATGLKNMRKFFENWQMLDAKTYEMVSKSASAIADLNDGVIDVFQAIKIPETRDFPVEDFFNFKARCYYIHRTAQEFLSEKALDKIIKTDAYEHKDRMPNNFSATLSDSEMARKAVMMFKDEYLLDFINVEEIGERDKETSEEMPEKLRKALPDVEELKKLL